MTDRACLIMELFEYEIMDHPLSKHKILKSKIKKIHKHLFDLYQDAGALEHDRIVEHGYIKDEDGKVGLYQKFIARRQQDNE